MLNIVEWILDLSEVMLCLMCLFYFSLCFRRKRKIFNNEPTATITSHTSGAQLQESVAYTFVGIVDDTNHNTTELSVVWSTDTQELCSASPPDAAGTTAVVLLWFQRIPC